MTGLPAWRLNLLRAAYLLLIVGLGLAIWPSILDPAKTWDADRGVIVAMLGAVSLLALIGLRHPLRMLPLLFWEIAWKALWLGRIALPSWVGGGMNEATAATAIECLLAILIVVVIPWDHVWEAYVGGAGDRWRRKAGA
jgi:hypothetical protein